MPNYDVYKVPKFDKQVNKLLTKSEIAELSSFIEELKAGNISGKRLTYEFFREKKIGGKRIYFLIYHDICIILLIASSDKKLQQETINAIKGSFKEFKKIAKEYSNT